jgi:hypothetical protein
MPSAHIVTASLTDDVATFTVTDTGRLRVGAVVHIDGLGHPYDGQNREILTVDAETLTITVEINHNTDVAEADVAGVLTVPVLWAADTDVIEFLGVAPATANDDAWLARCVDAANDWAYDRRADAGYYDYAHVPPSPRVTEGVILKAAELYRSRGSVDGFQSFQALDGVAPISSAAEILRMLGVNKPRVA